MILGPNTTIGGFSAQTWGRLIELFLSDTPVDSDRHSGTLIVIVDDQDVPSVAFHSRRGRVELPNDVPADLQRLADAFAAKRCIVLHQSAPQALADAMATTIDTDYLTQCLCVVRAFRELGDDGRMRMWPNRIANLPLPTPDTLRATVDTVVPAGHAIVLAVFDDDRIHTALAALRGEHAFERVVGAETIQEWVGPLGGDWTRDHRVICEAVSLNLGPVHVGLFTELPTCRRLLHNAKPGAWATATATREVIVHPMPPAATITLGIDGFRGLFKGALQALAEVDFVRVAKGFSERISTRPPPAPTETDLTEDDDPCEDDDTGFGPLI